MSRCCPHARSAGRFFSLFAGRYRRRFARKGFEPSQRQLLAGLNQAGFVDAKLLEIGCGVGHLHQTMLEQGAGTAVGVDLAPKMLTEARRGAAERRLAERTRYVEGDFVVIHEDLATADVTLLDKVVCCYPDALSLVEKSLATTRRIYGLTLPRDRWITRLGAAGMALLLKLFRSEFRPYVHSPQEIERWILDAGFKKSFEDQTALWLSQVYIRAAAAA